MRKIVAYLFILLLIPNFGCNTTKLNTANGAYSDISLTRNENHDKVVRLRNVKENGTAIFGIPIKSKNNQKGFIYRFNGINLSKTNGFLPTVSMVGLSLIGGILIDNLAGYKTTEVNGNVEETDKKKLGLALSTLISIPVAGMLNNKIWSNSSYNVAAFNVNNRLISENPTIDVFLNPKYEIFNRSTLFGQFSSVNLLALGAIIRADSICPDAKTELVNSDKKVIQKRDSVENDAKRIRYESFLKMHKIGDKLFYYTNSNERKVGKIIKIDFEYVYLKAEEGGDSVEVALKDIL